MRLKDTISMQLSLINLTEKNVIAFHMSDFIDTQACLVYFTKFRKRGHFHFFVHMVIPFGHRARSPGEEITFKCDRLASAGVQ